MQLAGLGWVALSEVRQGRISEVTGPSANASKPVMDAAFLRSSMSGDATATPAGHLGDLPLPPSDRGHSRDFAD